MPEFAEHFYEDPVEMLDFLSQAIIVAQYNLAFPRTQQLPTEAGLTVKSNVHARLGMMPHGVKEHNRLNISAIRSSDVGCFLQVSGTVIRTGTVRAACCVLCVRCESSSFYCLLCWCRFADQNVGVEAHVRGAMHRTAA